MKLAQVLWLKRVTTATALVAVCLGMNSATGPDGPASTSGTWAESMRAPGLGGSAIPGPGTLDPVSVNPGTTALASASRVSTRPVSVGNGVIPDVALHAYQRAAMIIRQSDATCGLGWELLAAIGRIESDHGRHGNSTLDKQGRATPAIIGIPLNGKKGTMRIKDSDAGVLDRDKRFDRAVGPMQFIPSTWSVVGVDADGDARRDPQDIDDAALAAAVHLCGRSEKLDTDEGLRDAVLRYNHSTAYADLVIALQDEYLNGNYSAPPTTSTAITPPVSARNDTARDTVKPQGSDPRGSTDKRKETKGKKDATPEDPKVKEKKPGKDGVKAVRDKKPSKLVTKPGGPGKVVTKPEDSVCVAPKEKDPTTGECVLPPCEDTGPVLDGQTDGPYDGIYDGRDNYTDEDDDNRPDECVPEADYVSPDVWVDAPTP